MTDPPFAADLKVQFHMLPPRLQQAAHRIIDYTVDVAVPTLREQARFSGLAPAALTRFTRRFRMPGYNGLDQLAAFDAHLQPARRSLRL